MRKSTPGPKRHHFVPKLLLRRFTNADGRIFFFDKRLRDKGVVETVPGSLFVTGHLYSHAAHDGTKDPALEVQLAALEGNASKVIDKIVDAARLGKIPGISEEEWEQLVLFIYFQMRRVPEMLDSISPPDQFPNDLQESIGQFEEQVRPLNENEKKWLALPKTALRLRANAWIGSMSQNSEIVLSTLRAKGLCVRIVANKSKSFVIGSKPVIKTTPAGTNILSHDTVGVWLPVSSDVLIGLQGPSSLRDLSAVNADDIRTFNRAVFDWSSAIAGRSRTLLESLVQAR